MLDVEHWRLDGANIYLGWKEDNNGVLELWMVLRGRKQILLLLLFGVLIINIMSSQLQLWLEWFTTFVSQAGASFLLPRVSPWWVYTKAAKAWSKAASCCDYKSWGQQSHWHTQEMRKHSRDTLYDVHTTTSLIEINYNTQAARMLQCTPTLPLN